MRQRGRLSPWNFDLALYYSRAGFASRMVRWLFLEWYGTLRAVSAPLVMPLHDSGISMIVPFTFRTKATIT